MDLVPEVEMILRLFISGLMGFIIGLERAFKGQPAGERTHALVALASASFAMVSVQAFSDTYDSSRVAAGVVTGLGFLGAGMILKEKNHDIHGLTTAAGIWAVGSVGLAIGSGLYLLGFGSFILVFIILASDRVLKLNERLARRDKKKTNIEL